MSELDVITVGRVNLDLYAQQKGVPFVDITSFDAMVGGSPTNVAIALSRLAIRAGLFTAVGKDLVGDWVLHALERERVDTRFVARKRGAHTSLALRAQLPPDHPLAFYRHDPADIHLTAEEADEVPLDRIRMLLISADALARGSTADVARSLMLRARALDRTVYLDLDLREVNWPDPDTYADTARGAIEDADVVLGTEEEFATVLGANEDARTGASNGRVSPLSDVIDERWASCGRTVVLKQGVRGATVFADGQATDVRSFPVSEATSIGAGDSFAAGLIRSRLRGLDWAHAGRFASACAALTVSRYGCSSGFPKLAEVSEFIDDQSPISSLCG